METTGPTLERVVELGIGQVRRAIHERVEGLFNQQLMLARRTRR